MSDNMDSNDDGPNGSFLRWQAFRIAQFTYAINLILGLSVAALGFEVTRLLDAKITLETCGLALLCAVIFLVASALSTFALATSAILGIWVVINRLEDFRITACAARVREKNRSDPQLVQLRKRYKQLGKRTWCLFRYQVGTFGFGIVLAVIGAAALVIYRLQ